MAGYHTAVIEITDAKSKRYSIPEEVVYKPYINENMRLEMIGLKVFHDRFAF